MGLRRVLVSAGDPSGDLILAAIVRELNEFYPPGTIEFVGLCGPASEAAGVKRLADANDVAVVGIVEVVKKLGTIFGVLHRLRDELPRVDSVLCVDFPDFNLKLAGMAKKAGKPVDYLVAPQVWAWRSSRVHLMRRLIRRLYPVLPFEEELFRDVGIDARFLGHPIRDLLPPRARTETRKEFGFTPEDFVFALMPGSRSSEITRHARLLLEAWSFAKRYREIKGLRNGIWRGLIPLAPGWDEARFKALLNRKELAQLEALLASGEWRFAADSRRALMSADFGWIASGTATLEAAWYQLPHILIYKLSAISVMLIRSSSSYFDRADASAGLPNILLGRSVLPELLQHNLSPRSLAVETVELLCDSGRLGRIRKSLRFLPKKLGESGVSKRIASDMASLWGPPK